MDALTTLISIAFFSIFYYCADRAYVLAEGKKDFLYNWTGHASLLCIITILLSLNSVHSPVLNIVAGSLSLVAGIGLIVLMASSYAENGVLARQHNPFPWVRLPAIFFGIIAFAHLVLALFGIHLLLVANSSLWDKGVAAAILLVYFALMFNRYDVEWILYKPSRFSKKYRQRLMRILVAIFYLVSAFLIAR